MNNRRERTNSGSSSAVLLRTAAAHKNVSPKISAWSPKLVKSGRAWNPTVEPNSFNPTLCRLDQWEILAKQRPQDIPFCDLHAMYKKDAEDKTLSFLEHSKRLKHDYNMPISILRICHGNGLGILKDAIHTLLKQKSYNFKIHSNNKGLILVKLT